MAVKMDRSFQRVLGILNSDLDGFGLMTDNKDLYSPSLRFYQSHESTIIPLTSEIEKLVCRAKTVDQLCWSVHLFGSTLFHLHLFLLPITKRALKNQELFQ